MQIKLKTNLRHVKKQLNKKLSNKKFRKVISEAMNHTGKNVVNAERSHLHDRLNAPRPQTIKSVVISQFAKPGNLAMTVRVKDWAVKFLHYIYSGDDEPARRTAYPSPTRHGREKAGKYGNILKLSKKGGLLARIDKTQDSQRKGSRFQGVPKGRGSKTYGVWERQGKKGREGLKLLVAYTPFIKHKKFIDFYKVGVKVIQNTFPREIHKEMMRRMK
tara:strand:+ start:1824 stop:2474 length:651 start_codon:yes stop_codon:yes gene_type:complete